MEMTKERPARLTLWLLVAAVGGISSLVGRQITGAWKDILVALGLALMIAGFVAILQEVLLPRSLEKSLERTATAIREEANTAKKDILEQIEKLTAPALYQVAEHRREYRGYNDWIYGDQQREVLLAGHSVLHRINRDLKNSVVHRPLADVIVECLDRGDNIRILMLDPCWTLFPSIADSQNQSVQDLAKDFCESMRICEVLDGLLRDKQLRGTIDVRTCQVPIQYAVHHVISGDQDEMIVGLYFEGRLGTDSPAFKVQDTGMRAHFSTHFKLIFNQYGTTKKLFTYRDRGNHPPFLQPHHSDCMSALSRHLKSPCP